jgi:hypothetical protein
MVPEWRVTISKKFSKGDLGLGYEHHQHAAI